MKKIILLTLVFISLLVFVFFVFPNTLIKNSTDIKTDGKGVLLLFSTSTCTYCKLFKKDIKNNAELNKLIKQLNVYEIKRDEYKEYTLWGKKTNLRSMERAFLIKVTPNIVIFDNQGRKIWQIPGYADPSMMSTYIKFVLGLNNGTYKVSQWREYLEKKEIIKK